MIAALLIAFFLGGSGGSGTALTQELLEDFDDRSQQVIADPARAKAVTAEVAAISDELKRFNKAFAKSGRSLSKSYKDHSADSASMQAQLDLLDADWEAAQARAIDHRFNIREQMTPEEWQAVFTSE